MPLTDTLIRKTKPNGKVQKLSDGGGLRLEITKAGTKIFKYRIRTGGIDTDHTLGQYPLISLAEARKLKEDAKLLVQQGFNPNEHKKQQRIEMQAREQEDKNRLTFNQLFDMWYNHNQESWSHAYADDVYNRVNQHLIPTLGNLFANEIKAQTVIQTLKLMEAKNLLQSMKKVRQYASRIFRFGVGMGYCEYNPAGDLPGDIFKKIEKCNLPFRTKRDELNQVLNAIDNYYGYQGIKTALQLAPHVFLRPKELAGLRWDEVDLPNNLITIESERMKMKRTHMVPLSRQAKKLIESMLPLANGTQFVFPGARDSSRPINEQSLNAGLNRLGFKGKQSAHGFRHTASTLLNEIGYNGDHIEKQLAHEKGDVRATYNKAEYIGQRQKMMQAWSDHIDSIKNGADVIPIHEKQN